MPSSRWPGRFECGFHWHAISRLSPLEFVCVFLAAHHSWRASRNHLEVYLGCSEIRNPKLKILPPVPQSHPKHSQRISNANSSANSRPPFNCVLRVRHPSSPEHAANRDCHSFSRPPAVRTPSCSKFINRQFRIFVVNRWLTVGWLCCAIHSVYCYFANNDKLADKPLSRRHRFALGIPSPQSIIQQAVSINFIVFDLWLIIVGFCFVFELFLVCFSHENTFFCFPFSL